MKLTQKGTKQSSKSATATSKAFTEEERGAIKGPRPRDEGWQGGGGERRAGEDRRDAGTGSHHGQAAPCHHQRNRARPYAETLVRDACVCQGRQGRLPFPISSEVQDEVRDVRLQRQGKPRRRQHVARRLCIEGVDCRRRGKDRRAREESGELRTELATRPPPYAGWSLQVRLYRN